MDKKKIDLILENHMKWLQDEKGGERADLRGANLRGADLRSANLRGADLERADLERANLRGADLRGADLRGADLERANLEGANLEGANLEGANLERADLERANLERANLRSANLEGANLRGANLRGADLDFSAFPLWCGSFEIKVDEKIAWQLLYHFCRLNCNSEDFAKVRNMVREYANRFHRVRECGEISGDEGEKINENS